MPWNVSIRMNDWVSRVVWGARLLSSTQQSNPGSVLRIVYRSLTMARGDFLEQNWGEP